MSLFVDSIVQRIKVLFGATGGPATLPTAEPNPINTAPADVQRNVDKRQPAQKPPPTSLMKRLVLLARPKRHRKEINMFPPAKVYGSGRHEVKTRHSKGAEGTTHAKKRGGHNK